MNRKKRNRILTRRLLVIGAVLLIVSAFLASCNKSTSENTEKPSESQVWPTKTVAQSPVVTVSPSDTPSETPIPSNLPIIFSEKVFNINDRENHVFIMSVDISDEQLTVKPYLSFNKIYGFETLTDMVADTGAYAGLNAGFFFEYGRPSGLVVIDGETVSPGSGKYESIVISEGEIEFRKVKTKVNVTIGELSIETEVFNVEAKENEIAVYSSYYGNTDRSDAFRKYLVINNKKVQEHGIISVPKGIPAGGYIIDLPHDYALPENIEEQDVNIDITPSFPSGTMAYEGASMLVKDGVSLAGDIMPWVGNLNHYDPRTCIGKLDNGRLGLVVIDGRQSGYSTGTTGRETADILIELGFTDAFMLDGGASSAMYYEEGVVNNPSDMGIERVIAGAILVFVE